jgi:D-alanyl-D-alanine carboxypeptidase
MDCVSVKTARRLRGGIVSLAAIVALLAVSVDPADARGKRKRVSTRSQQAAVVKKPANITADGRYAAIVMDVNSGSALHQANPDSVRHPASLTKIMTLYLLFERLESGKLKLDSELEVSAHAASRPPTKLGVKPGQTLIVEDAIKALVTRSANDAASVIAENIAGDEDEFAKLMTRKARALGMSRTIYKNASGLPNPEQVTTARDQALLGIAVQERFPKYYRYFATSSFQYRGQRIGNHNRLLGKVAGVDGIKTGYTRASGFNLVTSMRRGNRHIVAVVLGGASGSARDARMRTLVEQHVQMAATSRSASRFAEAEAGEPRQSQRTAMASATASRAVEVAAQPEPRTQRFALASAPNARPEPMGPPSISLNSLAAGSTDPIKPVLVKTVTVKPANLQVVGPATPPIPPTPLTAQARPVTPPVPIQAETSTVMNRVETTVPARAEPTAMPSRTDALAVLAARMTQASAPAPTPVAAVLEEKPRHAAVQQETHSSVTHHAARGGWMIQVGAFAGEEEAKQRLTAAQTKAARVLALADAFTERVVKGDKALYRARFAGFEKDEAEAACNYLKRNDIACMPLRN